MGASRGRLVRRGVSFAEPRPAFSRCRISSNRAREDRVVQTSWAYDPDLDPWLARRPALVLVTLGANEVDNPVPQQDAGAIRRLSRKVSAVAPCVWIAPPMWKEAGSEWLQVIHDNCAPCLFFDSDAVLGGLGTEERQRDRIHPNALGGARWAEGFWTWLEDHRDVARGGWALEPFERR